MLVGFGQGEMDRTAAAQMVAATACVYQNDLAGLRQLAGDGQVLAFVWRPDSWPPSYAIVRSPGGRWHVIIAGTTNVVPQLFNHIRGSFGRPGADDPALANGQWVGVWPEIAAALDQLVGIPGPNERFHLAGHSYGAAVAAIGGADLSARWGAYRVEVLTIGSPKVYAYSAPRTLPGVFWRFESTYDPVPSLPPSGGLGVALVQLWADPLGWLPYYPEWTHYGTSRLIATNGQFDWTGSDPYPLPPGVSDNVFTAHLLGNYSARLRANYVANGGPPAMYTALELADAVLSRPPAQEPVTDLPRVVRGPAGEPLTVPAYDGIPRFRDSPSAGGTAVPTPVSGDIVKITLGINQGDQGWSENYYCGISQATNTINNAVNVATRLAVIRKKILVTTATIKGIRVSVVGQARRAYMHKAAQWGCGPGTDAVKPAPLGTALVVRAAINDFSIQESRLFRGISMDTADTNQVSGDKFAPIPKVQKWIDEMKSFLRDTQQGPDIGFPVTAVFGIRGNDKTNNLRPWRPINNVGIDAQGRLVYTTTEETGISVGSWIKVEVNRTRCVRGVNGRQRVRSVVPAAPGQLITTLSKFCCNPADLASLVGRIQAVGPQVFPYQWFDASGISHRNTGGPLFITAGRRPSGCC